MRGLMWLALGGWFLSVPGAVLAQDAAPPAPRQIRDGGTRELLVSIYVPPVEKQPFTATLATQWTRSLANGGTFTLVNTRAIKRDSTGRVYQERWLLVPRNRSTASQMQYIQISDPVRHTYLNCTVAIKECDLYQFPNAVVKSYQPALGASGPLPDGSGFRTHEELGKTSLVGVDTIGYRESTTINAGAAGNDQPMVTTREFWLAPQLGIDLLSKLDSPNAGKQTFTVTELSTSEPEASFFEVPEGYKLVDVRKSEDAQ